MELEVSDKQQCVIDALLYKEKGATFKRTLEEITKACNFMSATQAASVLGSLKREGVTVKLGQKWQLTSQYLASLKEEQPQVEECAPQKVTEDHVIDTTLKIQVLQKLSDIVSDDIAEVLDSIIVQDLKGAA